jgi:hypothetical protein
VGLLTNFLPTTIHGSIIRKGNCGRDWVYNDRSDQCANSPIPLYLLTDSFQVTPFDVIKTRLQTQPPKIEPLFPRPPLNTCCQPSRNLASCVRNMSSLAPPLAGEVVCVWHDGVFRAERVNGLLDAVRHVWRAEGIRGLWKGAGTSLSVFHYLFRG